MFQVEYSKVLSVIENCILATDLELHFKHRDQMTVLFNKFKDKRQVYSLTLYFFTISFTVTERNTMKHALKLIADANKSKHRKLWWISRNCTRCQGGVWFQWGVQDPPGECHDDSCWPGGCDKTLECSQTRQPTHCWGVLESGKSYNSIKLHVDPESSAFPDRIYLISIDIKQKFSMLRVLFTGINLTPFMYGAYSQTGRHE